MDLNKGLNMPRMSPDKFLLQGGRKTGRLFAVNEFWLHVEIAADE